MKLTTYADKRTPTRKYRVGQVASITEVPTAIECASPHFMLFLALDAKGITNDVLRAVARRLLERGLAYLCVWGEDCSRVHDQFDLERNPDEPDESIVMTTWHDDESLGEALWYFANCAYPDDTFEQDCCDWVAISVASNDWEQTINSELIIQNEGFPP